MIGKIIGRFDEVFSSDLNRYILMGLFDENLNLGGKITDSQEAFLVRIDPKSNMIIMERKDDKFIVKLLYDDGTIVVDKSSPKVIRTIHTFALYYFKEGLPVYNSEY